jgi:hypothetical protein
MKNYSLFLIIFDFFWYENSIGLSPVKCFAMCLCKTQGEIYFSNKTILKNKSGFPGLIPEDSDIWGCQSKCNGISGYCQSMKNYSLFLIIFDFFWYENSIGLSPVKCFAMCLCKTQGEIYFSNKTIDKSIPATRCRWYPF